MKVSFVKESSVFIERLIFLGLLAIFSLSLYFKPINYYKADWRGFNLPDFSLFHYFGLYGPTCGLTRSFINLAHGRLLDGFYSNFIGPPLFLTLLLAFFYLAYRLFGGKKKLKFNLSIIEQRYILYSVIAAFIISWLVRLISPLKSLA